MRKIFIALLGFAAIFAACDYGNRNFVYPTPLPVVLSGTPIAVLVPTPAPTATPQPTATPANTATPQPTPTPNSVRVIGTSHGSSTSTSGFNTDIDMGSGGFGTATELEVKIQVRCQSANCGNVNLAIASNGTNIFTALFGNPILADTIHVATINQKRAQNVSSLFMASDYEMDDTGAVTELFSQIGAGINWSDDWDYRLEWSGVTSGATLTWIVNVERIN